MAASDTARDIELVFFSYKTPWTHCRESFTLLFVPPAGFSYQTLQEAGESSVEQHLIGCMRTGPGQGILVP